MSQDGISQHIGQVSNSTRVNVTQAAVGFTGSQSVEGVAYATDVELHQEQSINLDLIQIATDLATGLTSLDHHELDSIRTAVREEIGNAQVSAVDVAAAQEMVTVAGYSNTPLSRSLAALANGASIVGGGIAIAAINDPIASTVALPLTLALAHAYDPSLIRRLFERIKHRRGQS